jgi:hypothetical protein
MDQRRKTSGQPATPPPIAEWFNTATKGLCADARVRIRREIRSHYADAVENHLDEGLSEKEAGQRALEALGNPKKARRAFMRTYLTKAEARLVDRPRNWLFQVLGVVCTAMHLLWLPSIWTSFAEGSLWKALCLTGVVVAYCCVGMSFLLFHRCTEKRAKAFWHCVGMMSLALGGTLVVLHSDHLSRVTIFFSLPWILLVPYAVLSWHSLRRKLGKQKHEA